MFRNKIKRGFWGLLLFLSVFSVIPAFAATLPDASTVIDGVGVAESQDEFFVYNSQLLGQLGFTGFNTPAGVGQLDVVLYTQANGIDNDPVDGGFSFEDPSASATGGTSVFAGTWGAGLEPNGPVLVDDVVDYLEYHFGAGSDTPVFGFDIVEPGAASQRDLDFVFNVMVWDAANDLEVASWSLDNTDNGVFDGASFVHVPGEQNITGTSSTVYNSGTQGSGKYDLLAYSPDMSLSNFVGFGYEFRTFLHMINLNGGGEEVFIQGSFNPLGGQEVPGVPEPTSLAILGAGLIGLVRSRRKKTLQV